ncbi:MAG: hypothetical protein JW795_08340 [Chitinivibrionales bacterium]|nr:hypothetical protein [Chitinivibrionales bacterium]
MKGSHCKLYDENLVRNIMISTGISIFEYIKENKAADAEEICEFIEYNADEIIAETIKNLNTDEGSSHEEDSNNPFLSSLNDESQW